MTDPCNQVWADVVALQAAVNQLVTDVHVAVPVPTVTSVAPTSGAIAGGDSVVIAGTGFTAATAVNFGTTPATSFVIDNDTQITAVSPAEASGEIDVTVTNALEEVSSEGAGDKFTFTAPPAPVVTSVTPHSGGPVVFGTNLVIIGENFTGATAITWTMINSPFASTMVTTLTVNSDSHITTPIPNLDDVEPIGDQNFAEIYDVTVTTPGGTSSTGSGDQFNFLGS